jgi:hypothetical protein
MKPTKSSLAQLLCGNHRITVPLYQRKYEWEKDRIKAFWDDLAKLLEPGQENTLHYMGTMVRLDEAPGDDGLTQFMVIDGQQRITTLMLLMSALREYLEKAEIVDVPEAKEIITERLLAYTAAGVNDRLHIKPLMSGDYFSMQREGSDPIRRFVPTEFDRESFNRLVYSRNPQRLYRHFKHYKEFLKSISNGAAVFATSADKVKFIHSIFDALRRMNFVYICLDKNDKPQQIFESINYRGKPLSATDLIRNHVIRIADEDNARQQVFDRVWKPIQHELQRNDDDDRPELFEEFFRAYVAMRSGVCSDSELYEKLTELYPHVDAEVTSELIKRLTPLCEYASIYRKLASPNADELRTELGRAIYNFAKLNFITPMSLLMKFYRNGSSHPADQDIIDTLAVLESYYVRRAILGLPVKGMAQMFSQIVKNYDLKSREGAPVADAAFAAWLKGQLVELTGARKPFSGLEPVTDLELKEEAIKADVYQNSRTVTKYVLVEYEIEKSGDSTRELESCEIEHVMPQEIEPWMEDIKAWHPDLRDDVQLINERVDYRIHTLGNLTLISSGGNKALRNNTLKEKKAEPKYGYDSSNYQMTRTDFGDGVNRWSFGDIDSRSIKMFDFIIERFAYVPKWKLRG